MSEKYKHKGKPFTERIAMELIFKTYVGKPGVDEYSICEDIYQIHENSGGLPPKMRKPSAQYKTYRVKCAVSSALRTLKGNGGATKEEQLWRIHEEGKDKVLADIHSDEQAYPKHLGTGEQEVYLYYYPAYRQRAYLQRPPVWKYRGAALWECKIGETHDQDTETRTGQQKGPLPEKKVVALVMKTDNSRKLEMMIQEILKMWDRWIKNAEGKEWFLTSPEEVENIYHFLQGKDFLVFG